MKVTFKDLSWSLKSAVIASWIMGILFGLVFMVEFIIELVRPTIV